MNVGLLIKKEGIKVTKQLPTLQVNLVAKNISDKLYHAFPEHGFNQQLLFSNISRLNMYLAEFPNNLSKAKYVSENNSIYIRSDVSLDSVDDLIIHECLHFLQEIKDDYGNLSKLGLASFGNKVSGVALNEAAVQLMAAEANKNSKDVVTYFNIQIPTITPSYYTLECALLNQMAYFTGTYPLYNSTLTGSNLFKNTFISKSNNNTFCTIQNNLDKLVDLEDLLCELTNDLQVANNNTKRIAQINKAILTKKNEIFNLFFKTQNIIMTTCFNYEFKYIRNINELIEFKDRLYKYQYIIGTNKDYTFYNDFYSYTMNKFDEKYKYFEKHSYMPLGNVNETAITLFSTKPGIFDFIKRFMNKFKKLNGIKQENTKREHFFK